MKKSKLVSLVLVVIISLSVLFMAKDVLAATDLTNSILNNTTTNNSLNSVSNNTTNNTTNNTKNNTANNLVLTTNNTSNYNNTSLPKTGVADTMPAVILVVVLGISAVYAYKKMQEYKNI